jgi:uncharacterized membrane protein YbaN (DUF454 family)
MPKHSTDAPPKEHPLRGLLRLIVGGLLILAGILGLVLPVVPGWALIFAGAVTLAPRLPFVARLLDRLAERIPALKRFTVKAREEKAKAREGADDCCRGFDSGA